MWVFFLVRGATGYAGHAACRVGLDHTRGNLVAEEVLHDATLLS